MISGKRIGFDVDNTNLNWTQAFIKRAQKMGLGRDFPGHWTQVKQWMFGGKSFSTVWKAIENDPTFWHDEIEPLDTAYFPYDLEVYITNRSISSEITASSLSKHHLPEAPVETVPGEKISMIRQYGIDVFVDDKPEHFADINAAGHICLLFDAPHNTNTPDIITVNGQQMLGRIQYLSDLPNYINLINKHHERIY